MGGMVQAELGLTRQQARSEERDKRRKEESVVFVFFFFVFFISLNTARHFLVYHAVA